AGGGEGRRGGAAWGGDGGGGTSDARRGRDTASVAGAPAYAYFVQSLPPSVSAGGNETISLGTPFTRVGSFADVGQGQTWTATVRYGDGSGVQPLTLKPDGTFALSHTY